MVILNLLLLALKSFGDETLDSDFNGGWLPASLDDSMRYFSNVCSIPKVHVKDMTKERFEEYKSKPFILTFSNGAHDWVQKEFWTVKNLSLEYEDWHFAAGKSIDIVYNGGKGAFNRTFKQYLNEMREKQVPGGDFT